MFVIMAQWWCRCWLAAIVIFLLRHVAKGAEMTFELPDKETLCFFEEIEVHTKCLLDYQVKIFTCVFRSWLCKCKCVVNVHSYFIIVRISHY